MKATRRNIALALLLSMLPNIFGSMQIHACTLPFLHDCCSTVASESCCIAIECEEPAGTACSECGTHLPDGSSQAQIESAFSGCTDCVITLPSLNEGIVEKSAKQFYRSTANALSPLAFEVSSSYLTDKPISLQVFPPGIAAPGVSIAILRI